MTSKDEDRARASALATAEHIAQLFELVEWTEGYEPEPRQLDLSLRRFLMLETSWKDNTDPDELREELEETAREMPLSLQVRSGWHTPGETLEPAEYEVLLSTGGPAVRLVGELRYSSPHTCQLECQDWFTPWIEVLDPSLDHDALGWFASLFYWEAC